MKIGYNKKDITPTHSVTIAGYSRKKKSEGVLDPIEINTTVLSFDNQIMIMSILDSLIIENSVIIPVKNAISKEYNIPLNNIIIGCIHTHSAPAYFQSFFEKTNVEKELHDQLIPQFISSIEEALHTLTDATLKIKKTYIQGLYGNRNTMNGYSDKSIYVMDFINSKTNINIFSLISLACHPTILNGSDFLLSADLLGQIRKKYQELYEYPCMIINGCCGDVSTRFYRELSSIDELYRVSNDIIKQMMHNEILEVEINHFDSSIFQADYTYHGDDDFLRNIIPSLKQTIHENKDAQSVKIASSLLHNLEYKIQKSPMTLTLTSHIIHLGSLIFISLPGDITAILGKRIREAFPNHLVIILGYCENYSNYFVCKEDYGQYFETYISRLEKGNADLFIQGVINETKKLI